MNLAIDWLYWLPSHTDIFALENDARTQLTAKRAELEAQLVAERFTRSLDAYLFDATYPFDEPISDDTEPANSLVSSGYLALLSEQSELESANLRDSFDFDPFGFDMRVARDNESNELLLEVTCKSPELLTVFEKLPHIEAGRPADRDRLPIEVREISKEESELVERVFGVNPLESRGWYFELCARTTPSLTAASIHRVVQYAPSLEQRAQSLAHIIVSECSQHLFAAAPEDPTRVISLVASADTTALEAYLATVLPSVSEDLMNQELSSLRLKLGDGNRMEARRLANAALDTATSS